MPHDLHDRLAVATTSLWMTSRRASAADMPHESNYERFTTIDWVVDGRRERVKIQKNEAQMRRIAAHMQEHGSLAWRGLTTIVQRLPYSASIMAALRVLSGWFGALLGFMRAPVFTTAESAVVVLVGGLIGLNMALISVVTEWASDLKEGYCAAGWWLNKNFCCWEQMDPAGPGASSHKGLAAVAAAAAAAVSNSTTTTVTTDVPSTTATLLSLRANTSVPTAPVPPMDTCPEWVEWAHWTIPAWIAYIFISALLALACAVLVKTYAPYAAGSGISEIKCEISGFFIHGFLSAKTLLIKSLGLPLAIASGLSVGKEGPAVHVACCIGHTVASTMRWLVPSHAKLRELLTASSAAGVAVAFGSPVGGVLFALEEMTTHFPPHTMWRTFLCALASTVVLSFMNPYRTGKLVLFQVEYHHTWHYFEIAFFLLLGVFGGLYGEYVVRFNLQVQRFRRKYLAQYGVEEAVVLAIITSMISFFNMFMRIEMTGALEMLFQQCEGASEDDVLCQTRMQWSMFTSLLLATGLRFVFVVLSYGCKVPAGIFIPSMAVGATFGRMVGTLLKAMHTAFPSLFIFASCPADGPCIVPGTYAMLGAAAGLAGVTRITVAVVVIMFELTGALTYILPIMLVVGTSKLVADMFSKGGISDQSIRFNGYPFLNMDDHVYGTTVGEFVKHVPDVLTAEGMPLCDVEAYLARCTYRGFPVVQSASNYNLLGYMERQHLQDAIDHAYSVRTLHPDTLCVFEPSSTDAYALKTAQMPLDASPHANATGLRSTSQIHLPEESMEVESGPLQLGEWVDPAPLIVQPQMDLEVVADMFKQLGPRVVLVCRNGQLVGIVTIKDLLRHIAMHEDAGKPGGNGDTEFAVGQGELAHLLEAAWLWAHEMVRRVPWLQRWMPPPDDFVPLTVYETEPSP